MADIGSSTNPRPQQQIKLQLPGNTDVKKVEVYKGKNDNPPDFLIIVWMAFYSGLKTNEETAQVHTLQLQHTQTQEEDTNTLLASYNYTNISPDAINSSWNGAFAEVTETNDRVQAEINITQNSMAVEQQTGQTEQTNAQTSIQMSTSAMQQGVSAANEIKQIVDVIITI